MKNDESYKKTLVFYKGRLVAEKVEAQKGLLFLYNNLFGKFARLIIRTHFFARLYGWFNNSFLSTYKIKGFIKKYNIVMQDFVVPPKGFRSFNEFFTRRLKPDVRSVDSNSNVIVAPSDSKLLVVQKVTKETTFFVKDKPFCLRTFLQNKTLATAYSGGTLLLFRLAPYDYHWYHFPCDCVPSKPRFVNGKLESVHPIVYKSGVQPLEENERHIITLQTKSFGDVLMVLVGAMLVGKITEQYSPEKEYAKGDEAGFFSFGGSSVVLLFKEDIITVDRKFQERSSKQVETAVEMGVRVAQLL